MLLTDKQSTFTLLTIKFSRTSSHKPERRVHPYADNLDFFAFFFTSELYSTGDDELEA